MAVDFKSLLSKNMDEVKRPVPLPPGTYRGVVAKFEFKESQEKKTPFVRFMIQITAPGDDVAGDPNLAKIDLSKKQLRKDFYLTPDAEYRLKEFIDSCGIATKGQSFGVSIPNTQNAPVLIEVTQRPGQEDGEFFNDIGSIKGTAKG